MLQALHPQVYHFLPSSRVLVCTPSNSAADLICIRLHDGGFLDAASLARVNASCRDNEVVTSNRKEKLKEIFLSGRYIVCNPCSCGNVLGLPFSILLHHLEFVWNLMRLFLPSLSQKCCDRIPGLERTSVMLLFTELWSAPAPVLACSII